jgi:hypothetical protein
MVHFVVFVKFTGMSAMPCHHSSHWCLLQTLDFIATEDTSVYYSLLLECFQATVTGSMQAIRECLLWLLGTAVLISVCSNSKWCKKSNKQKIMMVVTMLSDKIRARTECVN